jgi:DNA-binding LytR/AlgR family response regulator
MIRAIAIDDEPPALKIIEKFCSDIDFIELEKTFTNPHEAMRYMKKYPVDLLFLDIQMPSVHGIDFYKSLSTPTMVIFTTAYSQYAIEGFNVNAIDYLLKPYTYSRFLQAVGKAQNSFQQNHLSSTEQSPRYLLIRADYSLVKVMLNSILYIEGLDDYLKIHIYDGKPIVVRMTMKNMLEKLPTDKFVRVHRSFIVAIDKIESIRNKMINLGDKQIPIGNRFEDEFQKRLQN